MHETVHEGATEVVRWMLSDARHSTHMRDFGGEMCGRIVAAGIPIWRSASLWFSSQFRIALKSSSRSNGLVEGSCTSVKPKRGVNSAGAVIGEMI